jgi:tetratricopeptide (TPR) repeat protein
MSDQRAVRIFLSSTFRDFGEERDLLVRKVFPALRARLKDRFVELVDVDLRWGITVEEAERGEVLPICLAEIDRSRPYFIGMLGERYGWVPPHEGYAPDLLESQPWLKKHQGGKSVTELEILHGVLKNKRMKSRALFYFRSPAYARAKGGHYVPDTSEDKQRQLDLKRRIKDSGYAVTGYRDPHALAKRMERDLWKLLDAEFPASEVPDAFERKAMRHEAYATPRRRLYLGGEKYIHALNALLKNNANRILITGQPGSGKSALIANALAKILGSKTHLLVHYLGSSSDAADTVDMVRRVIEYIRRVTGNMDPVAAEAEELLESVPSWLAVASAFAKKNRTRFLLVFDALNNLNSYRDLQWFPAFLPDRIQIVVSCPEGEVKESLESKGAWTVLFVEPLDSKGQRELLTEYLRRFNKSLPADLLSQALGHPLANNPLWLKTLAEELRLFGSHEELSHRLNTLLGPPRGKDEDEPASVDDLFEHVLQRIEADQGRKLVRDALASIWASRAGLSEPELLEILAPLSAKIGRVRKANKLPPAQWAPVRNALDEMLLESGGRIIFAHDYVRVAVRDRYLPSETRQRKAHKQLAEHFAERKLDDRVAEELPHQWRAAKAWKQLEQTLTNLEMFEALKMHRSNEEHLGYWLSLETAKGKQLLEVRFKSAWKRWNLPANKEKTADVAGHLVTFLRYAGRGLRDSFTVRISRLTLDITEKIKGSEHPKTGSSLSRLGLLLKDKADYAGAEILLKRALEISEKAKGPEHPVTGIRLNNLGLLLKAKGDYAGAESLFRRALAISEKSQGTEHPVTGTRLSNLGLLLKAKGDYAGAEPLYRRALAISEKSQGSEHPVTGTRLSNLGLLLETRGDYSGAEPLYRRALAIGEKSQGPEHPSTGKKLNNLGLLLKIKGDLAGAEPLYTRALAICEKTQGPEHPDTGTSLNNLGSLLKAKGDLAGAESLFRRALAISEKIQGTEHPVTGTRLSNLALLLKAKGDFAGAEPLYRRALAIGEKTQGPEHPSTGKKLNNLGLLLKIKGDLAGAESLYRRALAIAEETHGPEHPFTRISLNRLGTLLKARGDCAGAEPLYRRALTIAEKSEGPDHPETRSSLWLLGNVLVELSRLDEGIDLIYRELHITEKHDGEKSHSAADTRRRLGVILRGAGRYKESRQEFLKALEIFDSIHKRRSDEVAGVLNGLGQLEALEGNFPEAQKLFSEALEIRREVSPDNLGDIENHLSAAIAGKVF